MPDSKDLKDLDSQLKKTLISAESFKRGSSVAFDPSKNILNIQKTLSKLVENVRSLVNIVSNFGKIVNNNSKKITILKNISRTQSSIASGENIGAKLPGSSASNVEDSIATITKSVTSIAEILTGKKKALDNAAAFDRRKAEQEKRGLAEDKLEKRFEGLKSEAEKVISPVKSILDKIIDFFVTVFLGRVVYKLLEWFGDPKNADKVRAIGRFLGDHWPKLLALYLTFGTSFGRFALGLTKAVASGAIKLGFAIAKLLAAKKVKGAMGAARFLGGKGGKVLAGVLGTGAALGGAYAVTQGLKGGGEEQKTQGLAGGGYVKPRFATFSGGGLNLKGMLGGASMGAMLGPLGMLLGGAAGSGFVSGEKGVDKVPAMLTDGEFVMSTGAVAKYGVDTLEGMNAAGGGTNKPKIMNGTTYAAGGGLIGDINPYNPNQMSDVDFRRYVDGRIEERMADRRIADLRGRRSNNLPKPNPPRINPTKMLPAAGQSSANSMRAASGVRPPIPATSAIVPYAGSGLVNTGVTRGLSKPPVQQIRTNMNVPGGRIRGGSLSAIMAAFEMKQRKDEGQTNVQAGLGAGGAALGGQLGWMGGAKAGAIAGAALGSIVPGLGTGVGAAVGAIVGGLAAGYGGAMLGGKLADDFSGVNAAKERASRGVGGNIVGGYGLKAQSFKDAPKTSIITDDKGRPFVGHKAIKNGRLTYVRGSQPGTGTTNPLEMLGRFINPDAYKNNDAKLAGQKHKEAMVNALEGFQKQGMASDAQARMMKQMGGNLKDTQNDLNFRKKSAQIAKTKPKNVRGVGPSAAPKPKVVYGPPAPQRRNVRGGGSSTKTPSFSATTNGMRSKQETLGLMR
jgi:hypothetical protein